MGIISLMVLLLLIAIGEVFVFSVIIRLAILSNCCTVTASPNKNSCCLCSVSTPVSVSSLTIKLITAVYNRKN